MKHLVPYNFGHLVEKHLLQPALIKVRIKSELPFYLTLIPSFPPFPHRASFPLSVHGSAMGMLGETLLYTLFCDTIFQNTCPRYLNFPLVEKNSLKHLDSLTNNSLKLKLVISYPKLKQFQQTFPYELQIQNVMQYFSESTPTAEYWT